MPQSEINLLAYEMQEAYNRFSTRVEAVGYVKDRNNTADLNLLWGMWSAIDAYVDMSED